MIPSIMGKAESVDFDGCNLFCDVIEELRGAGSELEGGENMELSCRCSRVCVCETAARALHIQIFNYCPIGREGDVYRP